MTNCGVVVHPVVLATDVIVGSVVNMVISEPVVVISVIVVPVIGSPGPPVVRIISPRPRRAPYYITGTIDVNNHRPGCHFIIGGGNNLYFIVVVSPIIVAHIARIGCLAVVGFDDIVWSVKGFIADDLQLNSTITKVFDGDHSHILIFPFVEGHPEYNVVHIAVGVVLHHNVIHIIIPVEVEVIDHIVRIVQPPFESFERFGLLEEFHNGEKIQVIARKSEILPVVCRFARRKRTC